MSEKCVRCEVNPVVPGSMLCRACVDMSRVNLAQLRGVLQEIERGALIHDAIKTSTDIGAKMNAMEPCVCGHGKHMHAVPLSHGGDGLFHEGTPCIGLAPRDRPTVDVAHRCGCLSYRRKTSRIIEGGSS